MLNRRAFLAGAASLVAIPRAHSKGNTLVHISDFGGLPDGSDTTPAWNAAIAAIAAGPGDELLFGEGTYSFQTPPNHVCFDGFSLTGCSSWTTHLSRDYEPAGIADPFIRIEGRGSKIQELEIVAGLGTTKGYGLHFFADNNTLPGGKHNVEHVRIAGTVVNSVHQSTWRVPLHIQGDGRTTSPPIGMRGVKLYDVEVFDGTLWLACFWGAIVCDWYGGGAYQGGGAAKGIAVGGTNCQKNRIDADIWWAQSSIAPGTMRGPGM